MIPGHHGHAAVTALPAIDVHAVTADVAPARLWAAMLRTVATTFGGPAPRCYMAVIGGDPVAPSGAFPAPASTLPGFRVRVHRPEDTLELEGRHLFSVYRLRFTASITAGGRAEVRAHSFAEFPGRRGRAYRGVVVSAGLHHYAMERLMEAVRRDAVGAGCR